MLGFAGFGRLKGGAGRCLQDMDLVGGSSGGCGYKFAVSLSTTSSNFSRQKPKHYQGPYPFLYYYPPFNFIMKSTLLSLAAAFLLVTSTFAAPAPGQDNRNQDVARRDDRNDKDFNYGYDKKHKVTPAEKARWEAAHKNDKRDDRKEDDRRDANYGYDKNHKVTPQEKARWEAAHKNDRKDDNRRNDKDFNYGYAKNHRVTAQEKARWEAAHRNDKR